ncbi:LysR substrate-binding domain-containing protein [Paenibacillus sp. NPDC058071]|uniref:LysR substrate-binding domain-containing protein n=1 Tax=Paenibacillus sp. NPDC058071 TaxID=3346326 RepID=UPI0036DB2082
MWSKALVDACIIQSETELNLVYEAEDLTTVAGFVAVGLGISFVPRKAGLLLESLVWIPIEENYWYWEVGMQWPTSQFQSPAVKQFINYVKYSYGYPVTNE